MSAFNGARNGRVLCPPELLQAQYDLIAACPDYPQIRASLVAASEAFRGSRDGWQTHAYGSAPLQTLDFFSCGQQTAPLLIFVHGGIWQLGDKNDASCMAVPYLQAGIHVAVINYSLAPQAHMQTMVQDVQDALCWLHARAQPFRIAPGQIALMGHSAGAHLCAMAVAQTGQARLATLAPVAHAFLLAGAYDLTPFLSLPAVNQALQLDESRVRALSPVCWPGPQHTAIHTFVGAKESEQVHAQSAALAQVWQVATHGVVPDVNHFSLFQPFAQVDSPWSRKVIERIVHG